MKVKTIQKVLSRYIRNLNFLEQEALSQGFKNDADVYRVDRNALEQALKIIERSNTES